MALLDKWLLPKREQLIIIMIDASANIKNAKIEEINGLFRQVFCDPCIKELKDDPRINYSIAVMEYSDDCYWHSSNPIPLDSMEWKNIQIHESNSNFEKMCKELSKMLSRNGFFSNMDYICSPIVLLFCGNILEDECDRGMKLLKEEKNFFKASRRYAFALDSNIDNYVLSHFTGNTYKVFNNIDIEIVKEIINNKKNRYISQEERIFIRDLEEIAKEQERLEIKMQKISKILQIIKHEGSKYYLFDGITLKVIEIDNSLIKDNWLNIVDDLIIIDGTMYKEWINNANFTSDNLQGTSGNSLNP